MSMSNHENMCTLVPEYIDQMITMYAVSWDPTVHVWVHVWQMSCNVFKNLVYEFSMAAQCFYKLGNARIMCACVWILIVHAGACRFPFSRSAVCCVYTGVLMYAYCRSYREYFMCQGVCITGRYDLCLCVPGVLYVMSELKKWVCSYVYYVLVVARNLQLSVSVYIKTKYNILYYY